MELSPYWWDNTYGILSIPGLATLTAQENHGWNP
jgi:hypothetical protein